MEYISELLRLIAVKTQGKIYWANRITSNGLQDYLTSYYTILCG